MGRILAIDFGMKRVGVATTDPLQIIATALTTVPNSEILEFLNDYVSRESVECIVIGEPFRADGSHSDVENDIRDFIVKLKEKLPGMQIERQDESFTSQRAAETLVRSNVKKKDRKNKKFLDSTSATLILQDYLNNRG